MAVNLLDFDLERAGGLLRRAGREGASAPCSSTAGSTRRVRPTSRRCRPGHRACAASLRPWPRSVPAADQRARVARTAPSSGCSTSAAATPSSRCSIPEDDPWHAVPVVPGRLPVGCRFLQPPGQQGFSRNLSTGEIGGPALVCQPRPAPAFWRLPAGERAIDNVVMMGMARPLQNYDAPGAGPAAPCSVTMLWPVAAARHGFHLGLTRHDHASQRLPRGPGGVAARTQEALRDMLVPLNRKHASTNCVDGLRGAT